MEKKLILFAYGEMGPFALEALSKMFDLCAVVLPPENGRYDTSAVRKARSMASGTGLRIIDGSRLQNVYDAVSGIKPDAAVICSYDKIIPVKTLGMCPFINVHHGDLPRYRGRANINWAIINGRSGIQVTVHEVVPELDAGRIFGVWSIPIAPDDYLADVYSKVNEKVLNGLPSLIAGILSGAVRSFEQRGTPTYCCTRLPQDSKIDWNEPAENIRNLIRASSYEYPAFCYLNGKKKISILTADIEPDPRVYDGRVCGRIGRVIKGVGVEVLTKTQPLIIKNVICENRRCRADEIIRSTSDTLM